MRKSQNMFHFALHTYERMRSEQENRNIYRKSQGPVAGIRQAASMVGGSLETEAQGFVISSNGAHEPLHLNKGSEGEWKANAKRAITYAISAQLNSRLSNPDEDSEAEGHCQTDSVLLAVPPGSAGAIHPEDTSERQEGTPLATLAMKKRKGRHDLFGIGYAIDTFATNALTKGQGATILDKN